MQKFYFVLAVIYFKQVYFENLVCAWCTMVWEPLALIVSLNSCRSRIQVLCRCSSFLLDQTTFVLHFCEQLNVFLNWVSIYLPKLPLLIPLAFPRRICDKRRSDRGLKYLITDEGNFWSDNWEDCRKWGVPIARFLCFAIEYRKFEWNGNGTRER